MPINKHHPQPSSPKCLTLKKEGSATYIKTFEEILQDEKGGQINLKRRGWGMETMNRGGENFFSCNILIEIRGDYVHDMRIGKNRLL